jgi:uncharacterized membrane protein YfcA
VTGVINTIAGSGTLLTLPFFLFAGLPTHIANGTNRVGILGQSAASVWVMRKGIFAQSPSPWFVLLPTVPAGVAGAYVASILPNEVLSGVTGLFLLLLIYPILGNSATWLRQNAESPDYQRKGLLIPLLAVIGFYAGFIQMGSGIFLLTVLVLVGRRPLAHANMLKNLIAFCINLPVLFVYLLQGQVHWEMGLLVLVGQGIGGGIAAKYIENNPKANKITRYLLIGMLLLSAAKLFYDFFTRG